MKLQDPASWRTSLPVAATCCSERNGTAFLGRDHRAGVNVNRLGSALYMNLYTNVRKGSHVWDVVSRAQDA